MSNKADDLAIYGKDLFNNPIEPPSKGILADKFILPPFSVLNTCEGFWQERKRAWLSFGIKSEIGRGTSIVPNGQLRNEKNDDCFKRSYGRTFSQDLIRGENPNFGNKEHNQETTGASVFDPVLCELIYKWFCPKNGQIVDCFAGGSVRGIVASLLDYKYWGCDLGDAQIKANQEQADYICNGLKPDWICGDALDLLDNAPLADLIFSCPPYGDLERYSDDPRDLSTMEYHTFIATLKRIILRCYKRLNENRYACFVVGEYRDKKGNYHNFVGDTISAFKEVGFSYYNEIILVTARGSLPIRITKQFTASRKIGKTHQNIIVFVKGDGKKASKYIG